MTDAHIDTSGWHESADVITEGGHRRCAERMFVHDCGATLKMYSGCGERELSYEKWWWTVEWEGLSEDVEISVGNEETEGRLEWANCVLHRWKAIQ